ncbi:ArdC-like ssDNA-binding domain-containing protein [Microbacterium rhizosphaerae]|uniref:ArdC-like ssDNA-binding domain-containing protein n=1 Tax=Microbacterium rhizosphaerae TaxID=1678237 RepID=A0ABZ0STY1_9MICO|nr:ArdC-like ssDNA-binding domain-containing protein [Microbacterium rhizosphaerae]WPR91308.1 ArdC-like ssDNA-binding domain-containing protein [Microbacterium rhizosphaerae]
MSDQMIRSDSEAKLRELHERLVRSVEALIASDDWKRALEFTAHFRSRSFNNTLLIWAQHSAAFEAGTVPDPMPTHVAGFQQWHKLGRTVRAGQHGYMIFAPRTARFASSTPLDTASWRRLDARERPRPGEVVRSGVVGTRPAYVWDVSQTDGPPIAELPRPQLLQGAAPEGLWEGIASLIDREGFSLTLAPSAASLGGANGQTDFARRHVAVREDMDESARVKTLAHELGHIRLHGPDHEALAHRGIGEVEAESVALIVAAAHGMDTRDYTVPYVAGWASAVPGSDAVAMVQQTGERVRRAAVAILDALPTEQVSAGDPPGLDRSAPVTGSPHVAASWIDAHRVIQQGRGLS